MVPVGPLVRVHNHRQRRLRLEVEQRLGPQLDLLAVCCRLHSATGSGSHRRANGRSLAATGDGANDAANYRSGANLLRRALSARRSLSRPLIGVEGIRASVHGEFRQFNRQQ